MSRLSMWVIYEKPKDAPDKFVARRWLNDIPTKTMYIADTIEEIRKKIPKGLTKISRDLKDDPVIVEIWI